VSNTSPATAITGTRAKVGYSWIVHSVEGTLASSTLAFQRTRPDGQRETVGIVASIRSWRYSKSMAYPIPIGRLAQFSDRSKLPNQSANLPSGVPSCPVAICVTSPSVASPRKWQGVTICEEPTTCQKCRVCPIAWLSRGSHRTGKNAFLGVPVPLTVRSQDTCPRQNGARKCPRKPCCLASSSQRTPLWCSRVKLTLCFLVPAVLQPAVSHLQTNKFRALLAIRAGSFFSTKTPAHKDGRTNFAAN